MEMESCIVGWVIWEGKLVERNMSKEWVGVGTGCSIGYMEERWDFGIGRVA
jgi:hypothetical protein